MINKEELRRVLEEKLPSIRWWPWRGVRKEVFFKYYKPIGSAIITVILVDNTLFYLPLIISNEKPAGLPNDRIFKINNKYLYEAEFSHKYIDLLREAGDFDTKIYNEILFRVVKAEPLTLETTNIVAKHVLENNDAVIVKSYRLLSRINMEPLMLTRLYESRYKNIPRLYMVSKLGSDTVVSIVMEYVRGYGDGGYPFYISYKNMLLRGRVKPPQGYRLGLAGKLGTIIGELHLKLNPRESTGFFGLERISDSDISRWCRRLDKRFKDIMDRLSYLEESSERKREIKRYGFWKDILDKRGRIVIEEAKEKMELFRNGYKARIHQDLHLAQMIYVEEREDFIITDFEGEPGRSDDEKLEKEPPIRDIATMIRSFQYLAFMTYLEVRGGSIDSLAKRFLKSDPTWEWRMRHSLSMVLSYLSYTHKSNIHGLDPVFITEHYNRLIMPWLVERALYEILYEAMYRPKWVSVPIVGLLNPSIPTFHPRT
jgi:maltokinase